MTMCNADQLLRQLAENAGPILENTVFSNNPGIYGFFLSKGCLHIGERKLTAGKDILLYIGKTESSQRARDARQHLADGGTGYSTLRRSLGAILLDQLTLKPRPRGDSASSARRFTHFRFDAEGEAKLTKWMIKNLKLGFLDFRELDSEHLGECEQTLIRSAKPPLNILHNPDSPYRKGLKSLRNQCCHLAQEWRDKS